MIHFTCDCCKRAINTNKDFRYVVRLEVYASLDPADGESGGGGSGGFDCDEDRDHLQEVQDLLENLGDGDTGQVSDAIYHHSRFDLCPECRQRFIKNPLGQATNHQFNFSKN